MAFKILEMKEGLYMILQERQLHLPFGPEVSLIIIDAAKIVSITIQEDKKDGMTIIAIKTTILSVNFCNSTDVHNIKPWFINMK